MEIQINALRWIDGFFDVSPEDIQFLVPQLLGQILPALSNEAEEVRQAANKVNKSLIDYIISLSEDQIRIEEREIPSTPLLPTMAGDQQSSKHDELAGSTNYGNSALLQARCADPQKYDTVSEFWDAQQHTPSSTAKFKYNEAIDALTLQFLNKNEATRVASLAWLTMLQSKAPRKVLSRPLSLYLVLKLSDYRIGPSNQ